MNLKILRKQFYSQLLSLFLNSISAFVGMNQRDIWQARRKSQHGCVDRVEVTTIKPLETNNLKKGAEPGLFWATSEIMTCLDLDTWLLVTDRKHFLKWHSCGRSWPLFNKSIILYNKIWDKLSLKWGRCLI